jgi:Zinc dependent phospholipase C
LIIVIMPTPIQHLAIADKLLHDNILPGSIRDQLIDQRGAFLFGNTAPDVQTVSSQLREATHFFDIPLRSNQAAHLKMFELYPALAHARSIPPAQAAFIAGYICHLLLDVLWIRDIYQPGFGPSARWATSHERSIYHNTLRAWCDQNDQRALNGDTGSILATVQPDRWLPFTLDRSLIDWRNVLVNQFRPGASIRTIEVFAARNHVPPAEFQRVLDSPSEMDANIFAHSSRKDIEAFYQQGHDQMAELIANYLRDA